MRSFTSVGCPMDTDHAIVYSIEYGHHIRVPDNALPLVVGQLDLKPKDCESKRCPARTRFKTFKSNPLACQENVTSKLVFFTSLISRHLQFLYISILIILFSSFIKEREKRFLEFNLAWTGQKSKEQFNGDL